METAPVKTTSKFLSLNWQDFLRGLAVAALTSPVQIIYDSLKTGTLTIDWKAVAGAALVGGLAYLIKNFLTPATVQAPVKDEEIDPNLPKAAK